MNNSIDPVFYFVGAIAVIIISLFLMYVVIRSAVSKETKATVKELRRSNRLKYLELKRMGVTDEEIKTELSREN